MAINGYSASFFREKISSGIVCFYSIFRDHIRRKTKNCLSAFSSDELTGASTRQPAKCMVWSKAQPCWRLGSKPALVPISPKPHLHQDICAAVPCCQTESKVSPCCLERVSHHLCIIFHYLPFALLFISKG